MTEKEILLAFIPTIPILAIWIRLESRLSRLEGRFDMFLNMAQDTLKHVEKRHGS